MCKPVSRDLKRSRKEISASNPSENMDLEEIMQKAFCQEESDPTHGDRYLKILRTT